ncbi:hypothetical protein M9H77_02434 [Catharanthus roseus]|uniref:Uncharacterized protein n=1 Tax=Catharanthus roseus TaxID=4058 RepID=A0ACC0C8P8_CATRO|nr:hypothetical protein M9H77_02434 [Catharanthus roseus]
MEESYCDISLSINSLCSEENSISILELLNYNLRKKAKSWDAFSFIPWEFLDELISFLYCKEELGGLSPLKEMEHQYDLVTGFEVPTSNEEPMRNNASKTQASRGQGSFLD